MKKKIWMVLLALVCLLCLELYRSNRTLEVTHETVYSDKLTDSVRVVHLSDLHNTRFGADNHRLLERISREAPDLILFTGDLVTGHVKNTDAAMNLVEELVKIAPVYVSLGNHELQHENRFGSDLTGMIAYRGARVLEFAYEDIEIRDQQLRIGGISGYCVPETFLWTGEAKESECAYLRDFQNTERCSLLMCHMPVCWIYNDGISQWDADVVFSGHAHGGQIRIPLLGGLVAPDMGLFPGALEGLYPSGDGSKMLVLSRGLGNSLPVPRLNNPPQILVVDLLPKT